MNDFLKEVAEILEVEGVNETDKLKEFSQWDSLAILSIIAMVETIYGVNLHADDIKRVKTAGDLWNLVQLKKRS